MVTLGFDRQCITPQLPQPLCGYEMNRVAVEVHDDLYTRVILMNQDGELFALVQCDLIAVDKFIIERVYDRVKDLGIKKEHITIMICSFFVIHLCFQIFLFDVLKIFEELHLPWIIQSKY